MHTKRSYEDYDDLWTTDSYSTNSSLDENLMPVTTENNELFANNLTSIPGSTNSRIVNIQGPTDVISVTETTVTEMVTKCVTDSVSVPDTTVTEIMNTQDIDVSIDKSSEIYNMIDDTFYLWGLILFAIIIFLCIYLCKNSYKKYEVISKPYNSPSKYYLKRQPVIFPGEKNQLPQSSMNFEPRAPVVFDDELLNNCEVYVNKAFSESDKSFV